MGSLKIRDLQTSRIQIGQILRVYWSLVKHNITAILNHFLTQLNY